MLAIPGQRKGTWRYLYDGYTFHRTGRYNNRYHCTFRTAENSCRVYIVEAEDQTLSIHGNHNHEKQTLSVREPAVQELRRRGLYSEMSTDEIVDTVYKDFPEVVDIITRESAREIIYRERAQTRSLKQI